MFKALFRFFQLSLLISFLFSPVVVLAWNNMCYSPIQLASMFQPKKSGTGIGSLRKDIRTINSDIRKIKKELDKQEGFLADSLSQKALQAKPFQVASQIRDYMESQKEGWDCDEGGQSFLFQPYLFLDILGHLLIPPVYADTELELVEDSASENDDPSTDGVIACDPGYRDNQSGECVPTPATQCTDSGGAWSSHPSNFGCYCDPQKGLKLQGDKCTKCPYNQVVKDNKCGCPSDMQQFRSGHCGTIPVTQTPVQTQAQINCERGKGEFRNNQCYCGNLKVTMRVGENCQKKCNAKNKVWKSGQCTSCASSKKVEDNTCICPKGTGETNDKVCRVIPESKPSESPVISSPATTDSLEPCKINPRSVNCQSKQCAEQSKAWHEAEKVCCDTEQIVKNGQCKNKSTKPPCPEWKKHEAFGNKGKVKSSFCDDYASDQKECKKALKQMKRLANQISQLEDQRDELKDQLHEIQMSSKTESAKKTEASGICIDCLKRIMNASKPSTGQTVGNVLKMLTGVGIGAMGYNAGQRAQYDLNMLRIQQGYDAQNDYYPLQGASAGMPYMAQGLYGLTRTNTPVGGWSCSPTMNPYGHAQNYQHGQGFNMPYY